MESCLKIELQNKERRRKKRHRRKTKSKISSSQIEEDEDHIIEVCGVDDEVVDVISEGDNRLINTRPFFSYSQSLSNVTGYNTDITTNEIDVTKDDFRVTDNELNTAVDEGDDDVTYDAADATNFATEIADGIDTTDLELDVSNGEKDVTDDDSISANSGLYTPMDKGDVEIDVTDNEVSVTKQESGIDFSRIDVGDIDLEMRQDNKRFLKYQLGVRSDDIDAINNACSVTMNNDEDRIDVTGITGTCMMSDECDVQVDGECDDIHMNKVIHIRNIIETSWLRENSKIVIESCDASSSLSNTTFDSDLAGNMFPKTQFPQHATAVSTTVGSLHKGENVVKEDMRKQQLFQHLLNAITVSRDEMPNQADEISSESKRGIKSCECSYLHIASERLSCNTTHRIKNNISHANWSDNHLDIGQLWRSLINFCCQAFYKRLLPASRGHLCGMVSDLHSFHSPCCSESNNTSIVKSRNTRGRILNVNEKEQIESKCVRSNSMKSCEILTSRVHENCSMNTSRPRLSGDEKEQNESKCFRVRFDNRLNSMNDSEILTRGVDKTYSMNTQNHKNTENQHDKLMLPSNNKQCQATFYSANTPQSLSSPSNITTVLKPELFPRTNGRDYSKAVEKTETRSKTEFRDRNTKNISHQIDGKTQKSPRQSRLTKILPKIGKVLPQIRPHIKTRPFPTIEIHNLPFYRPPIKGDLPPIPEDGICSPRSVIEKSKGYRLLDPRVNKCGFIIEDNTIPHYRNMSRSKSMNTSDKATTYNGQSFHYENYEFRIVDAVDDRNGESTTDKQFTLAILKDFYHIDPMLSPIPSNESLDQSDTASSGHGFDAYKEMEWSHNSNTQSRSLMNSEVNSFNGSLKISNKLDTDHNLQAVLLYNDVGVNNNNINDDKIYNNHDNTSVDNGDCNNKDGDNGDDEDDAAAVDDNDDDDDDEDEEKNSENYGCENECDGGFDETVVVDNNNDNDCDDIDDDGSGNDNDVADWGNIDDDAIIYDDNEDEADKVGVGNINDEKIGIFNSMKNINKECSKSINRHLLSRIVELFGYLLNKSHNNPGNIDDKRRSIVNSDGTLKITIDSSLIEEDDCPSAQRTFQMDPLSSPVLLNALDRVYHVKSGCEYSQNWLESPSTPSFSGIITEQTVSDDSNENISENDLLSKAMLSAGISSSLLDNLLDHDSMVESTFNERELFALENASSQNSYTELRDVFLPSTSVVKENNDFDDVTGFGCLTNTSPSENVGFRNNSWSTKECTGSYPYDLHDGYFESQLSKKQPDGEWKSNEKSIHYNYSRHSCSIVLRDLAEFSFEAWSDFDWESLGNLTQNDKSYLESQDLMKRSESDAPPSYNLRSKTKHCGSIPSLYVGKETTTSNIKPEDEAGSSSKLPDIISERCNETPSRDKYCGIIDNKMINQLFEEVCLHTPKKRILEKGRKMKKRRKPNVTQFSAKKSSNKGNGIINDRDMDLALTTFSINTNGKKKKGARLRSSTAMTSSHESIISKKQYPDCRVMKKNEGKRCNVSRVKTKNILDTKLRPKKRLRCDQQFNAPDDYTDEVANDGVLNFDNETDNANIPNSDNELNNEASTFDYQLGRTKTSTPLSRYKRGSRKKCSAHFDLEDTWRENSYNHMKKDIENEEIFFTCLQKYPGKSKTLGHRKTAVDKSYSEPSFYRRRSSMVLRGYSKFSDDTPIITSANQSCTNNNADSGDESGESDVDTIPPIRQLSTPLTASTTSTKSIVSQLQKQTLSDDNRTFKRQLKQKDKELQRYYSRNQRRPERSVFVNSMINTTTIKQKSKTRNNFTLFNDESTETFSNNSPNNARPPFEGPDPSLMPEVKPCVVKFVNRMMTGYGDFFADATSREKRIMTCQQYLSRHGLLVTSSGLLDDELSALKVPYYLATNHGTNLSNQDNGENSKTASFSNSQNSTQSIEIPTGQHHTEDDSDPVLDQDLSKATNEPEDCDTKHNIDFNDSLESFESVINDSKDENSIKFSNAIDTRDEEKADRGEPFSSLYDCSLVENEVDQFDHENKSSDEIDALLRQAVMNLLSPNSKSDDITNRSTQLSHDGNGDWEKVKSCDMKTEVNASSISQEAEVQTSNCLNQPSVILKGVSTKNDVSTSSAPSGASTLIDSETNELCFGGDVQMLNPFGMTAYGFPRPTSMLQRTMTPIPEEAEEENEDSSQHRIISYEIQPTESESETKHNNTGTVGVDFGDNPKVELSLANKVEENVPIKDGSGAEHDASM